MRLSRILICAILISYISPISAADGVDSTAAVSQLNLLIIQYETRIKQLETENTVLKNEMAKAGIKIPLTEYSGAIITPLPMIPTTTTVLSGATVTTAISVETQTGKTTGAVSLSTLQEITTKHGDDVGGFISRIHKDWSSIKNHYKLSTSARIAGYEFVDGGEKNHVFVDIIIGTGTTWVYDMKILYQFEKKTYNRKLIGMFDYHIETSRYVTRAGGTNPFAWVWRVFVRDPYYVGIVTTPPTVSQQATITQQTSTGSTIPTATPSTTTTSQTTLGSTKLEDIKKAYGEKKYLSTISLSNTYLEKNPPTAEILNIRYRTFFIIGKYAESLEELAKMEKLGTLDRQTACNAQVIATYSKNTTLVTKYATICKK
jgi:hypothetical protein